MASASEGGGAPGKKVGKVRNFWRIHERREMAGLCLWVIESILAAKAAVAVIALEEWSVDWGGAVLIECILTADVIGYDAAPSESVNVRRHKLCDWLGQPSRCSCPDEKVRH